MPDEPGTDVAVPVDDMTGLEDFDDSDFVVPRLVIVHKEGVFADSQTNEKFDSVEVVALGLIKQRILWDVEVDEGDKPLCKSFDHDRGRPDAANFPWGSTPFARGDFGDDPTLDCESCPLKDWGSHPKNNTPWCTEQFVIPVVIPLGDDQDRGSPAILTLQRSSLKPARAYISGFAKSKTPLYTVRTKIELDLLKRGSVDYSVPKLTKLGPTDEEAWPEFASQYRTIREFVMTDRSLNTESSEDAVSTDVPATPAATPTSTGSAPSPTPDSDASVPEAEAVDGGDDDEVPF